MRIPTLTRRDLLAKHAYFNDRPLYGPKTGVGHYLDMLRAHWPTHATIELRGLSESFAIKRATRESRAFVFPSLDQLGRIEFSPLSARAIPRAETKGVGFKRTLRKGYETLTRIGFKGVERRTDFGILFEPNHLPSARVRPCAATIHDLSVIELPGFHPDHRVDWWRRRMQDAMCEVDKFICVSQTTADAMVRALGCDQDRLCVIPLASRWGAAPASWDPASVRARLGAPLRYWVHVGTIEPRKNCIRLLDAYGSLSASERSRTKLVLCGRSGWGGDTFFRELRDHPMSEEVLCTGYCDDAQVAALMVGSCGVLCPSHYEGFGLPTIEAMNLGVAAAISDAPSLVEVAGGTLPIAGSEDTKGWADVMRDLSEGPGIDAIEGARARASSFSWAQTARGHHDLFESMMSGRVDAPD